jgi:hypothetical protein
MKSLALLLLCCVGCFSQDSKPVTFRGGYIGQPLSDYADCSSGKPKSIKEGYKVYGNCKLKRAAVAHTRARNFMDPSPVGEEFSFENDKLVEIHIYIKDEDWAKTKYDLTAKLGSPISENPQVFSNNFGGRWEYGQGSWIKGDIAAIARVKVDVSMEPLANFDGRVAEQPMTKGIEIIVTDSARAKLPSSTRSTLD